MRAAITGEGVFAVSYGCEVAFDAETAAKVRAEVSARLGGMCPCDRDEPCPLLPQSSAPLLPTQRAV